jgi:hypothetical protein
MWVYCDLAAITTVEAIAKRKMEGFDRLPDIFEIGELARDIAKQLWCQLGSRKALMVRIMQVGT